MNDADREALVDARADFAATLAERESAFAAIDSLTGRETRLLRRSLNRSHVSTARRLGIDPEAPEAEAREDLEWLAFENPYYVARRGHLTPDALAALDSIGVRFQQRLAEAGLPAYRFVVSSAHRSAEYQAELRQRNSNAASGTSSHQFGTTFDIAYRRYRYTPAQPLARPALPDSVSVLARGHLSRELDAMERAWADRMSHEYAGILEAELGRALIELENEGVLISLREVRQPCFHVTVAKPLAS